MWHRNEPNVPPRMLRTAHDCCAEALRIAPNGYGHKPCPSMVNPTATPTTKWHHQSATSNAHPAHRRAEPSCAPSRAASKARAGSPFLWRRHRRGPKPVATEHTHTHLRCVLGGPLATISNGHPLRLRSPPGRVARATENVSELPLLYAWSRHPLGTHGAVVVHATNGTTSSKGDVMWTPCRPNEKECTTSDKFRSARAPQPLAVGAIMRDGG